MGVQVESESERMAAQFHSFLQYQLGHHSIETTRYYIRSIICKRAQLVIPFALPGNREELDKRLPEGAAEKMKMLKFFEGTPVKITDYQEKIRNIRVFAEECIQIQ